MKVDKEQPPTVKNKLEMEPGNWTYIGEGGKHAIFSWDQSATHYNEVQGHQSFRGRILRLEKSVIARSGHIVPPLTGRCVEHRNSSESGVMRHSQSADNQKFLSIMCEIFGPYADRPQVLDIDWQFLQQLRHQTIASGQIPARRRKDWSTADDREQSGEPDPVGFLHWDYRVSLSAATSTLQLTKQSAVVSLEIKPKAGYRTFSPLVSPTRRAKFETTRFVLLQNCYHDGKLSRGWMPESLTAQPTRISSYDPLDLFSLDISRIKRALGALLAEPQNNLIVRVNEMIVVNENLHHLTVEEWELVRDALGLSSTDDCKDHLLNMAAAVLCAEVFLSKILSLQRLDILDADGAICVYNRLVDLCGGSCDDAELLIDSLHHVATSSSKQPHNLLKESPLDPPTDYEGISRLCMEVENFSYLLGKDRSSLPSESVQDGFRKRALDIVSTLSMDECRYLLQIWLISLTVCDLSFFLAFHAVKPACNPNSVSSDERAYWAHIHQSQTAPGCLTRGCNDHYAYQLKIIDFDQKPAVKLRSRFEKEAVFDDIINS